MNADSNIHHKSKQSGKKIKILSKWYSHMMDFLYSNKWNKYTYRMSDKLWEHDVELKSKSKKIIYSILSFSATPKTVKLNNIFLGI